MKSIEFTEDMLENINEIGNMLFYDELDPRSVSYIRKLNRPYINWLKIIFFIFIPTIISFLLCIILNYLDYSMKISFFTVVLFLSMYIIIFIKKILISLIKIYQSYAPDHLRNKCRFEPSCSEYMVLSIEKYGFLKGLYKGVDRLKRCNINGGGIDFP